MPMLALLVWLTLEPSWKLAPPPVMVKVLVLPLFKPALARPLKPWLVSCMFSPGPRQRKVTSRPLACAWAPLTMTLASVPVALAAVARLKVPLMALTLTYWSEP